MKLPEFFGLDIGNHSIKLMQIMWQSDKPVISAIGHQQTPFGVLNSENADHQKELANAIKECIKNSKTIKTNKVVVALPESSIFTQLITIPKIDEDKLEQAIYWEAKKSIPIPIDEVRLDWIFIGERTIEGKPYLDLFIIAASNVLVERYINIMKFAGLEVIGIETESVATSRALWYGVKDPDQTATMILDFGAESTDMSVVQSGILLFSQSLATGSDALTKAIASSFNLEMHQAEQYKITYGLDETQVEGKIANTLKPIMQVIIAEVTKTLDFFRSRFVQSTPRKLLMVGDGAQLPGLMPFLTTALGLESEIADPFSNMEVAKSIEADVKQISSEGYSVAAGLALKTD